MISSLPTDETLRFLSHMLHEGQRILEVGCGKGELAAALGARGFEVTALDSSEEAVEAARERGVNAICADFLAHDVTGDLFDVVLFTRSLHHIPSLMSAVERAHAWLNDDGMLIAEEFGVDLADLRAAQWFYDMESLLESADLLPAAERKAHISGDALARWRSEHEHTPPLNTASAMEVAVMSRFARTYVTHAPYLYRTFCARLPEDPRGHRVARKLLEIEGRYIEAEAIAATGIRLAARRAAAFPALG